MDIFAVPNQQHVYRNKKKIVKYFKYFISF